MIDPNNSLLSSSLVSSNSKTVHEKDGMTFFCESTWYFHYRLAQGYYRQNLTCGIHDISIESCIVLYSI